MTDSRPHLRAIGLALATYTLWVGADTCLKAAGAARLSAAQIMGVVGLVEVLLLMAWGGWRRQLGFLRPRHPLRLSGRAALDLVNNLCVVVAVRRLPLAMFYILVFFAPLVSVLLAAVFLREPLDWRRGLAVVIGFGGVVIAVEPGRAMAQPGEWAGYVACLACVLCFATNTVWARRLTQADSPESLIFVYGVLAAGVGVAATLMDRGPGSLGPGARAAATPAEVLALIFVAVFSLVGSLCFFRALRQTSTANVVQYHYSQLITGAGLAFLIWRERPTMAMWIGAVVITAAGIYTAAVARHAEAPTLAPGALGPPDPTALN